MPFTIAGIIVFIAIIMLKLHNKNTYLMGTTYALFGII